MSSVSPVLLSVFSSPLLISFFFFPYLSSFVTSSFLHDFTRWKSLPTGETDSYWKRDFLPGPHNLSSVVGGFNDFSRIICCRHKGHLHTSFQLFRFDCVTLSEYWDVVPWTVFSRVEPKFGIFNTLFMGVSWVTFKVSVLKWWPGGSVNLKVLEGIVTYCYIVNIIKC